MAFYVLDENNNKIEALDKEGVLNAIEEAIRNGSLANLVADAGFITKLKCCVSGVTNKMGFITQAKYNELVANGLVEKNTLYYIYDDNTAEELNDQLEQINKQLLNLRNIVWRWQDGEEAIQFALLADRAYTADNADNATEATNAKYIVGDKLTPNASGKVIINKTGLYVCTVAETGKGTNVIYNYYNTLLNVNELTRGTHTPIIGGTKTTGLTVYCDVYYSGNNIYLDANSQTNDYKIIECRLIMEY